MSGMSAGEPVDLAIDPWLREILRCPACHSELRDENTDGPELVCTGGECGLAFPVEEGIPVLLLDEARPTR